MLELDSQADEIHHSFNKTEEFIKSLTTCSLDKRNAGVQQANASVAKCRMQIRSFQLELNGQSPEVKQEYQPKLESFNGRFRKLTNDLDNVKNMDQRKAELDNLKQQNGDEEYDNGKALDSVQREGDDIQDKTEAALLRTKAQAEETRQIAIKIEAEMMAQEEQMNDISKDLDETANNIARSKKALNKMASDAGKDKCNRITCACILILAIALIGMYAADMTGGEDERRRLFLT